MAGNLSFEQLKKAVAAGDVDGDGRSDYVFAARSDGTWNGDIFAVGNPERYPVVLVADATGMPMAPNGRGVIGDTSSFSSSPSPGFAPLNDNGDNLPDFVMSSAPTASSAGAFSARNGSAAMPTPTWR